VSNLNKKIYAKIEAWRNRRIEGEHPYLYLDGIVMKPITASVSRFFCRSGSPILSATACRAAPIKVSLARCMTYCNRVGRSERNTCPSNLVWRSLAETLRLHKIAQSCGR
jgi:hypothetical protein